MQRLLALVTIFALQVHSCWGCCGHHGGPCQASATCTGRPERSADGCCGAGFAPLCHGVSDASHTSQPAHTPPAHFAQRCPPRSVLAGRCAHGPHGSADTPATSSRPAGARATPLAPEDRGPHRLPCRVVRCAFLDSSPAAPSATASLPPVLGAFAVAAPRVARYGPSGAAANHGLSHDRFVHWLRNLRVLQV